MPGDDVLRLAVVGQILRRRWRLLLILTAVGAVLGAAASLVWPPAYESSSRVLLQGAPVKSRLLSEVQLAMSLVVLDRAAAGLNWGISGSDLRDSVTAELVDGNVLGITATTAHPERARQLAEQVTQHYIAFSTEILTQSASAASEPLAPRKEGLEKQIAELNKSISALQGSELLAASGQRGAAARAELEQLTSSRTQALNELNDVEGRIAQAQAQAAISRQNFTVIDSPELPVAPVARPRAMLVASGAVLAALLGAFVLIAIRQADGRLRRGSDIAAALGVPLLGTVAALAEGELALAMNGSAGQDQSLEHLRYQRVLDRLRGVPGASVQLLVVAVAGDGPASRAVGQLAAAASSADQDRARAAAVLNVVSVSATRPTIPEAAERSAVLVVVSTGTRTSWELLGIAEACQDAGYPVAGVLVVLTEIGADPAQHISPDQVRASATVGAAAGRAGEDPG